MRQVEIPKYGSPDVLRVVERPDPHPGKGQVRVAVRASGINFADILARMGLYQDAPRPPMVVGYEVSGVIDEVGSEVDKGLEGRPVLAMTRFGGHSDLVVVDQRQAVPMPEGMTFEQAAALPVNYLTAHHMLVYLGNLHPGERVLIHSAGGGVGLAAVQIATWKKAILFGTASERKHKRLRELGIGNPIDYTRKDFAAEVMRLTDGMGVHIVLDAVGGRNLRRSYRCLGRNGRLFCFGISGMAPSMTRSILAAAASFLEFPFFHPTSLMLRNVGVFGVNLGRLWEEQDLMLEEMSTLLDLFRQGVIAPVVDRTFPLERAADAHAYIQQRQNFGKVLLVCPPRN